MTTSPHAPRAAIGPDLRRDLVAMVKNRVPEAEVEDIVQATLTEAIESPHAPTDPEQLRRWLFGVAKHKVVDFHRRRGRESFEVPEVPLPPAPHVEADLLRWAEKQLPDNEESRATLDWMLREGEGEKLESIAASEKLPAPRVRQRVSRLRRHLKANWQREVALLAAVGVVIGIVVLWLRHHREDEPIAVDPNGKPLDPRLPPETVAEKTRREGLELCTKSAWRACLDKLDDAKRMDPAGDARPEVQQAREGAEKALAPSPTTLPPPEAPAPEPTSAPLLDQKTTPTAAPPSSALPPVPTTAPHAKPAPKQMKPTTSDFGSDFGSVPTKDGFTMSPVGSGGSDVFATKGGGKAAPPKASGGMKKKADPSSFTSKP